MPLRPAPIPFRFLGLCTPIDFAANESLIVQGDPRAGFVDSLDTNFQLVALESNGAVRWAQKKPGQQAAVNPSGTLVAAGDKKVQFYDAATKDTVFNINAHPTGLMQDMGFSPDGLLLATRSHKHTSGGDRSFAVWEVATGNLLWKRKTPDPGQFLWNPDGSELLVQEEYENLLLDASNGKLIKELPDSAWPLFWTKPSLIGADTQTLYVWQKDKWVALALKSKELVAAHDKFLVLELVNDPDKVAELLLCDVKGKAIATLKAPFPGKLYFPVVSPDGKRVMASIASQIIVKNAAGSIAVDFSDLVIWDVATAKVIASGPGRATPPSMPAGYSVV